MKAATIFSGGGGVEIAFEAIGVKNIWAIEKNPKIAEVFKTNFPAIKIAVDDIRNCSPENFEPIDFLHCSPPCQQFSIARKSVVQHEEANVGYEIIKFLQHFQPKYFTLENAPGYASSLVFKIILDCLYNLEYWVGYEILNAANFGVPQSRKRLILTASKNNTFDAPLESPHLRWYETVVDLIPAAPVSKLAKWQTDILSKQNYPLPVLMTRAGGNKTITPKLKHQPSPTVRAFEKWRGCHWADIILENRTVAVTPKMTARLCSFPDTYILPPSTSLSQQILGNSVPPKFMEAIIKSLIANT